MRYDMRGYSNETLKYHFIQLVNTYQNLLVDILEFNFEKDYLLF